MSLEIFQTDNEKLQLSAQLNGFDEYVYSEKYGLYVPKSKIHKIEKHYRAKY